MLEPYRVLNMMSESSPWRTSEGQALNQICALPRLPTRDLDSNPKRVQKIED